ncbi:MULTISPECIES: NADH-quinone oxidoreductase subunit L [Gammaproteobacteria]|uniref:NADH-quinone oxidoreductase subunit L n=1 Tax=Gammaproteobacteria TaxID=1236 RepID=UPI000DCF7F0A|nr:MULTISPECIES: NADH-quinone oxidoreductase subunit L [Gammaproteobacteria]RTE86024.1 NADH-quinone oxidoreductase subunit L [Aliidiomarina sp. B3213]TCZ91378.1 NADH-quinone oxidoreductase subunit L [Lysobacter sp. N42]
MAELFVFTPFRVTMLLMILVVAFAVINFSKVALQEEPRKSVYWRYLFGTLGSVFIVIVSNHLLILWLAWVCISLCVHNLLLFYPERPRALLAAHKKFIIARIAEISLLGGFLLYGFHVDSFYLSDLLSRAPELDMSAPAIVAGSTLIAVAVLLKCAQLPAHGWLIQVVESPTPVSALLHAGVVNLGGFLLIVLAPIVLAVDAARWVILVVAGLGSIVAALIMTTRISYKVRLAWSTSAQMGLMLVEIALGMYELAVVHIVAHSFYKAYAFLSSGSAVNETGVRRLAVAGRVNVWDWLIAGLFTVLMIITMQQFVSSVLVEQFRVHKQESLAMLLLLAVAVTMFIAQRHSVLHKGALVPYLFAALGIVALYFSLKFLASWVVPRHVNTPAVFLSLADIWISTLVLVLAFLSLLLHQFPHTQWAQKLSMVLFAGLYIDEWATRLTLTLWPIHQERVKGVVVEQSNGGSQ